MILKILITLFLLILIPFYWKKYGAENFLWLSDIGLFLTFFALWFESPLLISMAIVGILPFEMIWTIDFLFRLITKRRLLGITDYMFDLNLTKFLRSLSLFHIFVPIIWIYFLFKWGYDTRAVWYQTYLFWFVLILTYFFTNPEENINWVFIPKVKHWTAFSSYLWLISLCIIIPLTIFLPLDLLLAKFFIK